MMIALDSVLLLAALMFLIGTVGVVVRKNAIVVFMCIELMLNAANLTFVAAAGLYQNLDAQITVLVVMTVAAAEAAVGLAIVLAVFRNSRSIDTTRINVMKG